MIKKTVKLISLAFAALLCFTALCKVTAADELRAEFMSEVYTCAWGQSCVVSIAVKNPNGGKAELVLVDQDGVVLAHTTAEGKSRITRLEFVCFWGFPRMQVLSLQSGGELLCTATLVCDKPNNIPIKSVATGEKLIAFTFDAANGASQTARILDLLDSYGAKCTFFVIGKYIVNNGEISRDIVQRGHELSNHSYEHLDMPTATAEQAFRSLERTIGLIADITGDNIVMYRPPSGISRFQDRAIARAFKSEVVNWTVDSRDGFGDSRETIIRRVTEHITRGGIVLFHVYGDYTLEGLEYLLPYYTELGYRFVTVSELLFRDNYYIDENGVQRLNPPEKYRTGTEFTA